MGHRRIIITRIMATGDTPDQFEGGAFSGELPEGRTAGQIDLAKGMVQFHSENGDVALPVRGLKITRGGAANRMLFLKHPGRPEWTLYTHDAALLKHPALEADETVAQQTRELRRRRMAWVAAMTALAVMLVAAVLGAVLARDWMVGKLAQQVPASWEEKLGETAFKPIKAQKKLVTDRALLADFNKLSERLVKGIGSQRYEFRFFIVRDPSVNAFALPGGTMALHTGLLLAADSAEEVAGVMAHELAHVTEQHSVRMLIQAAGLYAVVTALFGDATGLMAVLANNAPFLLTMKFSRDHEREADERGLEFLLRARVDPRGMLAFFRKLAQQEASSGPNMPDLLKTHPATAERIKRLEQLIRERVENKSFTPIDLNYKAFKVKLKAHLDIKP